MGNSTDDLDPRVARTREAVLDAVRDLVRSAGLEAVTHQQVAEAAGVGRATVYRHWPDRTKLLVDALTGTAATRTHTEHGDLAADLTAELTRLQAILNNSPFVPQVAALVSRAEWDPELADLKQQLMAEGTAGLRRAIEAGVARDELSGVADIEAAVAILAGPLFFKRLLAGQPITDDLVAAIVARFTTTSGSRPVEGPRLV
ncbi:MAG: TetR/AcrR family transcriptional regulator [Acidimicrobiales bacterium]|nr:TetR/AcrR family transcriptional regulator [Acidimicrobiales bacterium]